MENLYLTASCLIYVLKLVVCPRAEVYKGFPMSRLGWGLGTIARPWRIKKLWHFCTVYNHKHNYYYLAVNCISSYSDEEGMSSKPG